MMLKGLGDIGNIMKLQKEFKNIQKKITGTTREGASPNGKVKAVVNGEYRVQSLSIDPAYLAGAGAAELENMVRAAVNSGVEQIKEFSASEMANLTGGLNIPGLGSFFK
jgi:nucleoid-associated protein EbfC